VRRRVLLLVAATTSLVLVAFLVPLALLVRTVATERAPWFLPQPIIRKAFRIAEERGGFQVDAVSPADAARSIRAPTLLVRPALSPAR